MKGMRGMRIAYTVVPLLALLLPRPSQAQAGAGDVYWRIDPSVKSCSMVIDPSLTQAQWHTFTRQVGAIGSFKSLASAEPLGRGHFALGIDYSVTPINQRDPAWINTFVHPDENCPLGDQIHVPTVRARVGLSGRLDLGASWTTAPQANYGFLGGQLKYAVLKETARVPAAAVYSSATMLTGVPDFDLGIYDVGIVASKRVARFAPYVGVRNALAVARETTTKVDLKTEQISFAQGFAGTTVSVWKLGLAAEFDVANVNTFALVIGFQP